MRIRGASPLASIESAARLARDLELLFLLQGEDRSVALRPVGRDEAWAWIVVRPERALAAQDVLVVLRLDRVDGVRKRVGGCHRVEQQWPPEIGVVARRVV